MMTLWNRMTESMTQLGTMLTPGKLIALFLVGLLFLWLADRERKPAADGFLRYSAVMAVLCICPVTAGVLMCYQTAFYDYKWLWSAVPVTAVVAYTGVRFRCMVEKNGQGLLFRLRSILIYSMLIATVLLCGDMGHSGRTLREETAGREKATLVLEQILEMGEGENICLWAPGEILEWSRAVDGRITLLYGRDMWDGGLGAYTYDVYDKELVELYRWMEQETHTEVSEYVEKAREAGADCILLPADAESELSGNEGEFRRLEDYLLLMF